jgi:hypothetical protein
VARWPKGSRGRPCQVCRHPQVGKIDWLICSGAGDVGTGRRALAKKFGLGENSIANHGKNHISAEYRASIVAGPWASQEELADLAAAENVSVLQNLRVLVNGHRLRWLASLEAHNDFAMIRHAQAMGELLWKIAKLTHEVAPPPSTLIQNNMQISLAEHPDLVGAITTLAEALRPFPEARRAAATALRTLGSGGKLIEAAD